jgi:DNA polymerase III subunit gamma/tau
MAYTVLARRYRSSTFDQIVGQEHIAQTLKKAIVSGRVAHAYLFCGTRGTGKTSTARILAKAMNCSAADGATPTPCGKCDSCLAIARGDDIDVIEIDAASNTGVDNVREIIENSQYRPARSRFKIYIIDEVHMLSKSAFNALLKTLEEPPSHVKFILATTEPEKVLPTILSRCQRYDFRNIPAREIAGHLKDICKQEKIQADEEALALVAKAGAGSMRDALSLLDRLLSIGEKHLTAATIEQMLGLPRAQLVFDLGEKIGSGDTQGTLSQAEAMISSGLSADALVAALSDHFRNLLIARTCGSDSALLDIVGMSATELVKQAEKFDAVVLAQDIAILEELRRNLRQNQTGRALLDATLVRLALAEQFASIAELLSGNASARPASTKPASAAPVPPSQKKKLEPPADFPPPEYREREPIVAEVVAPIITPPLEPTLIAAVVETPVKAAAEPSVEAIGDDDVVKIWPRLVELMTQQGSSVGGALSLARLTKIEENQAVVQFRHEGESFARMWEKNGKRDQIAKALTQIRGRPIGVRFEVEEAPVVVAVAPPAAAKAKVEMPERESPAMPQLSAPITDEIKADPMVQAVLKEFGGVVVKVE